MQKVENEKSVLTTATATDILLTVDNRPLSTTQQNTTGREENTMKNQVMFERTQKAVEMYEKYKNEKHLNTLYNITITTENMYYLALAVATKKAVDMYSNSRSTSVDFENELYHLKNSCYAMRFDDNFNIINNYPIVTTAVDMVQAVVMVLCQGIGKTMATEIEWNGKTRVIKNICYDVARQTATDSNGYTEIDENYTTENGKRAHRKVLIKAVSLDDVTTDTDGNQTTLGDVLVYEEQNIQDYTSALIIKNARKEIKDALDRKIFDMLLFENYSLADIGNEIGIDKSNVSRRIKAFAVKYPKAIAILQHKA